MNTNNRVKRDENGLLLFGLQFFAAVDSTPEANLTSTGNTSYIPARARDIDFVSSFGKGIAGLQELLGVQRRMPMASGSLIKTYTSSVTLAGSAVAPGEIIPLSLVQMEEGPTYELAWRKRRKAVPAEDIQRYGLDEAVRRTDELFIREHQKEIRTDLLTFLKTGTGVATGEGLQAAASKAWGGVKKAFEDDATRVVAFVHTDDLTDYLGSSAISTQSEFGLTYVKNFLGIDTVIVGNYEKGVVLATAADNLILAYANMAGSDVAAAFEMATEETGLLGVTHDINKARLTAETITAGAIKLFAERLDGVIKATITAPSI